MKRELSCLATLSSKNITLVSVRKQQAAYDVPELLIIDEKSKAESPVTANSNSQNEEKRLQSYSMGMPEVSTVERQVSELVCVCWEGRGVSGEFETKACWMWVVY